MPKVPGQSSVVPPKDSRKRGRPRGNPTPLNEEEKKLRNAQYERERRNEASDAMTQLQEAMRLEGRVSNNEIISTAINRISNYNHNPPEDLDTLRRQNKSLEEEVARLEMLMADGAEIYDSDDGDSVDEEGNDNDDEEEEEEEQEGLLEGTEQCTEEQQLDAALFVINNDYIEDYHFYDRDEAEAQFRAVMGME